MLRSEDNFQVLFVSSGVRCRGSKLRFSGLMKKKKNTKPLLSTELPGVPAMGKSFFYHFYLKLYFSVVSVSIALCLSLILTF